MSNRETTYTDIWPHGYHHYDSSLNYSLKRSDVSGNPFEWLLSEISPFSHT